MILNLKFDILFNCVSISVPIETSKLYTTLGYIVSLILLNLGHNNVTNITKSCVYLQFKMFHQEASVETVHGGIALTSPPCHKKNRPAVEQKKFGL